jgi:hypothetical protein
MSPICSGPLSARKEIEVLDESLREQAAEIAKLERIISRREALLVNYSVEMRKQSEEIAALRGSIVKYEQERGRLTSLVGRLEERVDYLTEALRSHHGLAPLRPPILTPNEVVTALLDAPCVFCGYKSYGYFQEGTHAKSCPWHSVGGEVERKGQLRAAVQEQAAEIAALREAVRLVCVKINGAVWVAADLMDDAPISAADNPGEVAAILRALKEK